jgi:glycosyltransferase involved in cell wall biosynthesis
MTSTMMVVRPPAQLEQLSDGGAEIGRQRATVSVVVPARNEARNIGWVLRGLPSCVDEVVLVDGFSRDQTVEAAREARPDVVVVSQRGCGKGAAMRTGFERATSDFVVVLDADGSMDPGEVDDYVTALADGYEFVKGSRFLPGGGSLDFTRVRSVGNRTLVRAVNLLWGVPFTDLCYGYLAFRRDCLSALALTSPGFEIETEICIHAVQAGLRIAEVPSVELARQWGASNLHPVGDGLRILRTLLRERLAPQRRRVVDAMDRRGLLAFAAAAGSITPEFEQLGPV